MKITHIINPVVVDSSSDLYKAQPITFASLYNAKNYISSDIEVKFLSQQYAEDINIVPDYFQRNTNLSSSILDLKAFKYSRKLPLIKDLLAVEEIADHYIYSNVDIALMPHFYESIIDLIRKGHDAIAINRRTISNNYDCTEKLPLMYADMGKPHEGIDCFIFSKAIYEKFNFFNAFIGSGPVGLCFVANMITFAKNFLWLEDKHLTFHIGNDRRWTNPKYNDYIIFNNEQLVAICEYLLRSPNKDNARAKKMLLTEILGFAKEEILNINKIKKSKVHFPKQLLRHFSNKDFKSVSNRRIVMPDSFRKKVLKRLVKLMNKNQSVPI